ncbi:NUDIX hydrolase [Streptomyces sp. NPDC006372]|uniref:NUDIX hydrolase n=1 Tax=Streptomyces sp. NPDC006372 TaxID=3155599 RepID=UPI00339DAE36
MTCEATNRRRCDVEYDNALEWLLRPVTPEDGPLATEVWAFDTTLTHVLMVDHRWRGWVAPGGKVDPGETPREAAVRELFEETGLAVELFRTPAAVTVRSYHPDWPAVMGVSFMTVVDRRAPLAPEDGQPAAWLPLDEPWQGYFSADRPRMKRCIDWIRETVSGLGPAKNLQTVLRMPQPR